MKNIFKNKSIASGVVSVERDGSILVQPSNGKTSSLIVDSLTPPINNPIIIVPKIKPVKWYQFWRYKDKKKYAEDIKRCKKEFDNIYGTIDEQEFTFIWSNEMKNLGITHYTRPFKITIKAKNREEAIEKCQRVAMKQLTMKIFDESYFNEYEISTIQQIFDDFNEQFHNLINSHGKSEK